MRRLLLIISLTSVLFSCGIYFFAERNSFAKKNVENFEAEESEMPLQDRADLAFQQEFNLTKDPALNIVPKERLVAAYNTEKQLIDEFNAGRSGPIAGVNWTERGPNNCGGRTLTILVNPNDPTKKSVFAGGAGAGLWKTNDITQANPDWAPVNDFFNNLAVTTIAFNPSSTTTMYFGTGEGWQNGDAIQGNGIWKSTDGGLNWSQLAATNNSSFYYVQKIVVHSSGDVYAATRSGLQRSQDGGTSWTQVLASGLGASSNRIADIEIAANNSLYVSTGIFQTDGVYFSSTGNTGSWTKLNTGANGFPTSGFQRIELACAPSNASVVYALAQASSGYGIYNIYKTINGGTTWTTCGNPVDADGGIGSDFTRGQGWYDLIAAVDPNNENNIFIGGVDLFKSSNGGTSWQQISHWYGGFGYQYVHADQHAIMFEPGNSSVIYFGNDGGFFRSANATAAIPSIISKDAGYNATQFYGCAINPTAYSNQFLAGAQDNGSHKYTTAGVNSTIQVTGGDGCFTHIDQNQQQYQFTSYVYNNYYRSTDGGNTFTSVSFGNFGSFVNPTDYDDVGNIMYGASNSGQYMRWTNPQTGATMANVTITNFGGSYVTHVSVSPNTANRVFFGLANGSIIRIDNANTIATNSAGTITGTPISGASVSCIAIENGNDNHLLVTYSNYGVNSVWETTNALSGTPTWTSVEGNLPDMPVRWALFDPSNNQQALLATELGVWSTNQLSGAGTLWGPSNTGLANVRTDMLQIRSSDNMVIAATHGRGLFSSDVFTSAHVDFSVGTTFSYIGKTIQFTDASYKSTSWLWDFGDGTFSTQRNPVHAYNSSGLKTIALTINGNGALTMTKTNYIQVLPNRGTPYLVANGDGGSFDVGALDFASENINGTPFEKGSSVQAGKSGTISAPNSWVTGLAVANYNNNSISNLYSPNYNFSMPGTYTLKFYSKYSFENQYDGFRVEYSLDKGTTWNIVGAVAAGWYNWANNVTTTSFPVNEPYFSNNTGGNFQLFSTDISSLAGNANVAFRFVFKSDVTVTSSGAAIDNFEIVAPVNIALPVQFTYFNGIAQGDHNLLQWQTSSEINNSGFEILRSADAKEFIKIGFVNGAGNSTSLKNYSFIDHDIHSPIYYYKLKQIDYDGKNSFSNVIALRDNSKSELAVSSTYPNPFDEKIFVLLNKNFSGKISAALFDISGKKVFEQSEDNFNSDQFSLNVNTASPNSGIYFLKIVAGEKVFVQKVVKR